MQLEKELVMVTNMSEEWDAPNLQEHWNTFSTKIRLLSELEAHSNQKLRDTLSNHQIERDSFPPDADGELYICLTMGSCESQNVWLVYILYMHL